MSLIYHLAQKDCWNEQSKDGSYKGCDADLGDGFLHFSTREQIVESARIHKAGRDDLILLAVVADDIPEILRWEKSRNNKFFPHVYGEIPVAAVKWSHELQLDEYGRHIFPELKNELLEESDDA